MACLVHCRIDVFARSRGGDEITPIFATTTERFPTNVPWALARGMVGSGQVENPPVGRSNDEDHDDVP
jgi:hypothetical protein